VPSESGKGVGVQGIAGRLQKFKQIISSKGGLCELKKILGTHLIVEVTNCNADVLNDEPFLHTLLLKACKFGGAGIISSQSHKFKPHGVTILVLLSESHASMHTWPECGYLALDCFTCGKKVKTKKIVEHIQENLEGTYRVKIMKRGMPSKRVKI
jgi:S-adenosylmethionine decarboxylase